MLDYGLHQRQVQKLVMTPKLRQSIAILQMPAQELAAYVAQQIVDNPALDPDTSEDEAEESYVEGSEDLSSEDTHDIGWHISTTPAISATSEIRGGAVSNRPCLASSMSAGLQP